MLGRFVVSDDQLLEYGPHVSDDLQNGQVLLDAFHREVMAEFGYLGWSPIVMSHLLLTCRSVLARSM
jgi:hypothetical protein